MTRPPIIELLICLLLPRTVFARNLVIHEPEAEETAMAMVVLGAGVPHNQLVGVDLLNIISQIEQVEPVDVRSWSPCDSDHVMPGLIEIEYEAAVRSIDKLETDTAELALEKAHDLAGCVGDLVSPEMLARGQFLYGVLEQQRGNKPEAWNHFTAAAAIDPTIQWDNNYAPDIKATFDAATSSLSAQQKAAISVVVPEPESGVFVDGIAVTPGTTLHLPPGEHLLQRLPSAWLTTGPPDTTQTSEYVNFRSRLYGPASNSQGVVPERDSTLMKVGWFTVLSDSEGAVVVPEMASQPLSSWVGHESGREMLTLVLPLAGEIGDAVFVVTSDHFLSTTVGGDGWVPMVRPSVQPVVSTDLSTAGGALDLPKVTTYVGGIITGIGLAVSAWNYHLAATAHGDLSAATTPEQYEVLLSEYEQSAGNYRKS